VAKKKSSDRKGESPTVDQVARTIVAALRKAGNPARARAAQRYFSDEIVALGVTAPAMRDVVRRQVKPLRGVWTLDDAVKCCDLLLKEPQIEVRGAGILVLAAFKRDFTPVLTDRAYKWLGRRLDNWALVDSLSGLVMSPLLETYPQTEQTLRAWSKDRCLWVRRAALVTLVPFARRGQLLDLSYRLVRDRLADREALMHKAIGWLLREAGRTDPQRLRQFLLRHGPAIPRVSLRYAIEHFSGPDRADVMNATRGRRRTRKDILQRRKNS
jgi:3-methyladenine DNA glycosylase AlkD